MLQGVLLHAYGKNTVIEQLGRSIVFFVLNGGIEACKPQKYYALYDTMCLFQGGCFQTSVVSF